MSLPCLLINIIFIFMQCHVNDVTDLSKIRIIMLMLQFIIKLIFVGNWHLLQFALSIFQTQSVFLYDHPVGEVPSLLFQHKDFIKTVIVSTGMYDGVLCLFRLRVYAVPFAGVRSTPLLE